jgi:SAM-dependent methyltransferase
MPSRNEFDDQGYLDLYPDVARGVASGAIESGWQHFAAHGFAEGRAWLAQPDPTAGVSQEISPHDEMFSNNAHHYFDVGASALHCIETALFAARRRGSSIKSVLDLPCGHGRVMRFLRKAFPDAQLTACDLNQDGVEYCAQVFGAHPVLSCEEISAIPLHDTYDLIWCGSLLTHLPEEKCAEFLRLFQRLLRPGGIVVFTIHGRREEPELASGINRHRLTNQQIVSLLEQYRSRGFGYVEYTPGSGYGLTLALPSFVLAHFVQQPGWKLLGYYENHWDKLQDVICLQRQW